MLIDRVLWRSLQITPNGKPDDSRSQAKNGNIHNYNGLHIASSSVAIYVTANFDVENGVKPAKPGMVYVNSYLENLWPSSVYFGRDQKWKSGENICRETNFKYTFNWRDIWR